MSKNEKLLNFDQGEYWKKRVSGNIDIGVVGHRSLGRAYNEYIYRRRIEVVNTIVTNQKKPSELRVLDIACGSGFYVNYWHNLGVKDLVGVDISAESIAMMGKRYPEFTFYVMDITEPSAFSILKGKFNLITLFDVVYHITDNDSVARLFHNIAQMLSDDGIILVFDHICRKDYSLVKHVVYRGNRTYQAWLSSAGLFICKRIPLFVLLSPPILEFKAFDFLIAGLYKMAGTLYRVNNQVGRFFGFLFYKLDQIARSTHLQLPNSEVLILKRNHLD